MHAPHHGRASLHATFSRIADWHTAAIVLLLLAINVAVFPQEALLPHDWLIYELLPARLENGTLYEIPWAWSPVAAWVMAALLPIGYTVWATLHVLVLALLRDWRLILLTLLSVPFWIDTVVGHTTTFVLVAGVAALRGSRGGALASLGLFLLAPRPVEVPLVVWLLWRRPEIRLPFGVMAAAMVALTLASGYADDWIAATVSMTGRYLDAPANFSPTRWLGIGWLIIGLPLAAWLTWRGRVGIAGLVMAPYVLPQYPLLLLWELCTGPFPAAAGRPSRQRAECLTPR